MAWIVDDEPTLCLVRGRSRNRPHPVLTGGQSLSDPKKWIVSPGPGRITRDVRSSPCGQGREQNMW